MFWRLSFSLISTIYAVDVAVITFGSLMCDDDTKIEETPLTPLVDSCVVYKQSMVEYCEDTPATDCDIVLGECYTGDFIMQYTPSFSVEGIIFNCEDTTDAPTAEPTAATCFDDLFNGDEEDVDCGGDECDPCPTNCEYYSCGSTHTLVQNPETTYCAAYPCVSSDVDICCEINALCSDIPSSVGCGSNSVLISASTSTYCSETECQISDRNQCCVDASTCENFSLCDDTTQYLRDDPDQLFCASDVCDAVDISKCCADKAACSTFSCNLDDGVNNVANDENIYCEESICTDDDSSTCCTARGSCATFTCDESTYVDKTDKDSLWCWGSVCVDTDWDSCCDWKATCVDNFNTYSCVGTGNELVDNPRDHYCDGKNCTSPRDDYICCPPDMVACNSDACSNLDESFVDAMVNCTGNPCTTSDTQCCIQRAQCSEDICDSTTQLLMSSYCERDICSSTDVNDCCLDRESCDLYNCTDDRELIAEALCATDSCDDDDIVNCCTEVNRSSGSDSDGTMIAIGVVVGLLVVAIICGLVYYKVKSSNGSL